MKILKIPTLRSRGFIDRDHVLLHAAFAVLVEFWEKEQPGKCWSFEESKDKQEWLRLKSLYYWWKFCYPIDIEKYPNNHMYYMLCTERLKELVELRDRLWT